jgi:PAS domain S-box-containing protein
MFETFCRSVGQFFQTNGACCCTFSGRDGWTVAATHGDCSWGAQDGPLSPSAEEWAEQVRRDGRAALFSAARDGQPTNRERSLTQVVVPFLNQDELLGAAFLSWAERSEQPAEVLLERLTLLGTLFAGLLDHARLFEQVFRSREKWLRVIDAIPDLIVVHDDRGNVVRINRSLAERAGVHPSKLIGLPMREVLPSAACHGEGSCPFCPGSDDGFEGPFEISPDCSFLVSTTRFVQYSDRDAQTIHVLVNVHKQLEAERRYRDLFDSVQEGAFCCTPEGSMVEANPALVRMLGYSIKEELLQANLFADLVSDKFQRDRLLEELSKADSVRNHEAVMRRKDGSHVDALVHLAAVREPAGSRIELRGLILDVTDQKISRAALQRERDFNQRILTHTQNIILVLDAAGQITYVNHRAEDAGYSEDILLGLPLARLIHTSHRPVYQVALRSVLDTGTVQTLELPVLRGDGGEARFVMHLSSMREEPGGQNRVVAVMTDVTEASLLQAKLARTEKMAALGRLVSGVAHEVNNPLSAIVGFTDLLLENKELPDSAREELGFVLQEGERTRLIVQNMLRFAREMPPQREPLQVNIVLRQALKLRSYGLTNRNIEIVERLSENLPVVVADPHQLEQVFLNILNNAFDALEEAGRHGKIEVETAYRAEAVEIRIRDNGNGISNPERIFEPFFTTKPVGKGTGLGLSICYGIIQAHLGEIACENNAGEKGCTFLIRLPAATMHAQVAPADASTRM